MARFPARLLLALGLLAATACDAAEERGDVSRDTVAATAPDSAAHVATTGSDEHADAGHAAPGAEAQALLPIMQRLGSEMTALTHALMTDDHATVTRSAAAIAAHAPVSAAELARIRTTLGPDVAVFEAVDESVHVAAVRLHEAARAGRPDAVVQRLGEVQRGCVSCHVRFRARLRTAGGGG